MTTETLLIVEDNHVLREGLREMLSIEGFTVLTASNGREALQQMSAISPDLILSDITMPEMDGFTFFNSVRDRPDWIAIPFIFLTARGEQSDVLTGKSLGAEDYLIKPLQREVLVAAVRGRLARSRQVRMAQLQHAYESSLTVLANAIDLRDPYTRKHVQQVTDYSLLLAASLGWQERRMEELRFGAILHDIGKIDVNPRELLWKTTPLTETEWLEIKRHPVSGSEMIKNVPYLSSAVPIIRHHHERWDGGGYPDGLAGNEIPEGARIVSVADSFDAMTTFRPYSPTRTPEEAYLEILRCSGAQYDPAVVAVFQHVWNNGQIQQVIKKWN